MVLLAFPSLSNDHNVNGVNLYDLIQWFVANDLNTSLYVLVGIFFFFFADTFPAFF